APRPALLAGVLLLFSFLVVPAAIAALLATGIASRLAIGWAVGTVVSLAGLLAAYRWGLPPRATIVAALGAALALAAAVHGARSVATAVHRRGARALRPLALAVAAVIALA